MKKAEREKCIFPKDYYIVRETPNAIIIETDPRLLR